MRFLRSLQARFILRGLKSKKASRRFKTLCDIDRIKIDRIGDPRITDLLLKAINDEDRDVRRMAAARLGDIRDPRGILPLIQFLKTEERESEMFCAKQALTNIGLPAIPHLIQVLCEYEQRHVLDAVSEILIDVGEDSIKPLLVLARESSDSRVICAVARILGKIGNRAVEILGNTGEEALPLLTALLKDEELDFYGEEDYAHSYMSDAFARAFTNIGERAVAPLLSLASDRKASTRRRAIEVLSKLKPPTPGLRDLLITCLKDEDRRVRCAAASGLIQFTGDPEVFRPLCQALMDRNEAVRAWAATTLASTHGERGMKSLIALLKREKNGDVQKWHIQRSLVAIGEPAVKPLIDVLTDSRVHPPGRITAVWALRELRAKSAFTALTMALNDRDPHVRHGAIIALQELGDAQAGPHLVPLLWHKFWNTRELAAEALGKLRYSAATNMLIWALTDNNERVRKAAAQALRRLTGRDLGQDPMKWQAGLPSEAIPCDEPDLAEGTFSTFSDPKNRFSFQYPATWFRRSSQGQLFVFPSTGCMSCL